jgi:hypothetical protein
VRCCRLHNFQLQDHVVGVRGAGHLPALLIDDGESARRENELGEAKFAFNAASASKGAVSDDF